jgi:hypothetical protein
MFEVRTRSKLRRSIGTVFCFLAYRRDLSAYPAGQVVGEKHGVGLGQLSSIDLGRRRSNGDTPSRITRAPGRAGGLTPCPVVASSVALCAAVFGRVLAADTRGAIP